MSASERVIQLGAPTFGDEELAAVANVLESGWVAGQGPMNQQLERDFAARVGTKHAVAVSSCTAALHLCLMGLEVAPGDEVIVADYTFIATGHAVLFVGATPVFVDVRRDTYTIDPDLVAQAITAKTRGIIAVDVFGQCADYDELENIAADHSLFLIEDAAAAAGASYRGRQAGSFGRAGCFSLHGRKGITCGEGGVITTDDDELASSARMRSAFGITSAKAREGTDELTIPVPTALGYNYKLSDVHAAIAVEQLKKLDELVARRQTIAARYAELLADVEGVTLPSVAEDRVATWQSYVLSLEPNLDRNRVATMLRAGGVQSNIGTYASHLQPVYASAQTCPSSAGLFSHSLAIPMHANLTEQDVERVARQLRKAVNACREV